MSLDREIEEQPEVIARLLDRGWPEVARIATALREERIDQILIVARGSSDHAGLYARYLFGIRHGLPVAMAMPSLVTRYRAPTRLRNTLVVGISQSGRSPDLVETLRDAAARQMPTVVITNAPDSPLANAARHVIDLAAGPETAVAATKTYSAQLAALAMLSTALAGDEAGRRELAGVPESIRVALAHRGEIARAAERYRYMDRGVVLGRGYHHATAHEWSLKLKELCYVMVSPYSSADFRHGPIAVVDRGFAIFAIVTDGPVASDLTAILRELRERHAVESLVIGDHAPALAEARLPIALPPAPEWTAPIASIVPAQLFTAALTRLKGHDPENPRGLSKVTTTE